jgi:hypothetical protein
VDDFEPGQDPAPPENSADSFAARLDADAAGNSPQQTEVPAQQEAAPAEQFSGHPAWKPFEDALGPIHYRSIEPHLRSMNQAFESKIAAQNKSLEAWKGFIDEGIDPDELKFTRQLAQEINTDPVGFYNKMADYLRQTGQLEAAAQADAAADQAAGVDPEDPDVDPRVAQLEAKLAQFEAQQTEAQQAQLQWIEQQQYEQQVTQVMSQLENEVQALKSQGVDDRTVKAIIDRAELHNFRTGKPRPLAEIHQEIVQEQQFIRSQPQAVDRAPRLPGVTGGAPSQGTADLSSASRSQSVDTLAALIEANRGR